MTEPLFLEYQLTSPVLCLGERKKKGTYRSSVLTIPYSQISGALEAYWGRDEAAGPIHAAGVLVKPDPDKPDEVDRHTESHVYARRDNVAGVAVLPIETRLLTNVVGRVFVARNDFTAGWGRDSFTLKMGAYRQKGLGECRLTFTREAPLGKPVRGRLLTRIPEDLASIFGLEAVRPVYGYLFRPDAARESGVYVRSLLEGSLVSGPAWLVKEEQSKGGI